MANTLPMPHLSVTAPGMPGNTHTVILVLPGGRARDNSAYPARRLAIARMIPIAWAARRGAADARVAVWRLRYRYRGWNEPARDPVIDVGWALDQVRERHPGASVILVGHSMGGRAALYAAGDPSVVAVCALAPWLAATDPVGPVAGRTVLLVHGDRDRITDPAGTRWYAAQAAAVTSDVRLVRIPDSGHGMLRHWRRWHALVADFVAGVLAAGRAATRRSETGTDGARPAARRAGTVAPQGSPGSDEPETGQRSETTRTSAPSESR